MLFEEQVIWSLAKLAFAPTVKEIDGQPEDHPDCKPDPGAHGEFGHKVHAAFKTDERYKGQPACEGKIAKDSRKKRKENHRAL